MMEYRTARSQGLNAIKAIVRNGRIETDEPIDLPEGTALLIPLPNGVFGEEHEIDNSPKAVAAWLKWSDTLESLVRTEKEETAAEECGENQRIASPF